jgi:hypothetical protein
VAKRRETNMSFMIILMTSINLSVEKTVIVVVAAAAAVV